VKGKFIDLSKESTVKDIVAGGICLDSKLGKIQILYSARIMGIRTDLGGWMRIGMGVLSFILPLMRGFSI
jgi:hypothetical protein